LGDKITGQQKLDDLATRFGQVGNKNRNNQTATMEL